MKYTFKEWMDYFKSGKQILNKLLEHVIQMVVNEYYDSIKIFKKKMAKKGKK